MNRSASVSETIVRRGLSTEARTGFDWAGAFEESLVLLVPGAVLAGLGVYFSLYRGEFGPSRWPVWEVLMGLGLIAIIGGFVSVVADDDPDGDPTGGGRPLPEVFRRGSRNLDLRADRPTRTAMAAPVHLPPPDDPEPSDPVPELVPIAPPPPAPPVPRASTSETLDEIERLDALLRASRERMRGTRQG